MARNHPRYLWLGTAALLLTACNSIGSVEERAEAFNQTSASYVETAILYNILRASQAEPLHFVSVTGNTGHDTLTTSVGLPTFVVGPDKTPVQKLYAFGPNTVGATVSNDFNISVVNDPQSFAALLKPVDPATLGFLINQPYEQRLVLFLFISRIQVYTADKKQLIADYVGEPLTYSFTTDEYRRNNSFKQFHDVLARYVDQGLSVKVDPTFVPQGIKAGTGTFCFDSYWFDASATSRAGMSRAQLKNLCSDLPSKPVPTPKKRAAPALPAHPAAAAGDVSRVSVTTQSKEKLDISISPSAGGGDGMPAFSFTDQDGHLVEVRTRSVFGAYRFLGELLDVREQASSPAAEAQLRADLPDLFSGDAKLELLHITHATANCWVEADYESAHWCIDANAWATKREFAILHQLFELYAAPSNQPATPTVRVTPG